MLLEIDHVTKAFGGVVATNDVSATFDAGKIYSLIGPNGAGKTTLFNLITGAYVKTSGKISFDGKDLEGMKTYDINRIGIARTFQNIRLFKQMTVLENVMTGMHSRIHHASIESFLPWRSQQIEREIVEKSMEALKIVGLDDKYKEFGTSLSYGQQRRLEIARALVSEPKLLLLDEPAAGMNPQETLELAAFIHELREKYGLTIFLIEHHMDLVMRISDYIYVIDFGSKIAEGIPQEVQNNQHVIDAYLGVVEDE